MIAGRWLRAVARFWVDFLVGDDWLVAAGVGLALLATWGLVLADVALEHEGFGQLFRIEINVGVEPVAFPHLVRRWELSGGMLQDY